MNMFQVSLYKLLGLSGLLLLCLSLIRSSFSLLPIKTGDKPGDYGRTDSMNFTLSGIEPEICVSTTIRVIFAIRSDLLFGRSVSGLVDVPIISL